MKRIEQEKATVERCYIIYHTTSRSKRNEHNDQRIMIGQSRKEKNKFNKELNTMKLKHATKTNTIAQYSSSKVLQVTSLLDIPSMRHEERWSLQQKAKQRQ